MGTHGEDTSRNQLRKKVIKIMRQSEIRLSINYDSCSVQRVIVISFWAWKLINTHMKYIYKRLKLFLSLSLCFVSTMSIYFYMFYCHQHTNQFCQITGMPGWVNEKVRYSALIHWRFNVEWTCGKKLKLEDYVNFKYLLLGSPKTNHLNPSSLVNY